MRNFKPRFFCTGSLVALTAAAIPGAAFAQPAEIQTNPLADECVRLGNPQERAACLAGEPYGDATGTAAAPGTIVVTGSRIRRPNLDSTVPVTSVSAEEIMQGGDVSLGDQLNELPALRSTFSTGNAGRFIGTAGLNILDLRGLGTARTLVLVNNRRHVTGIPGAFAVDTNTIPIDLLERTDIVTGGNSAIYGSDAVAGVVNFILRRDFEGLVLRGQGGISDRGDRGTYFVAMTAGRNFLDNRANIAVSAEYAQTNPLYFTDRDDLTGAFSGRCQFNLTRDVTRPSNSGEPDQQLLCGVRNANIYDGGQIAPVGSCAPTSTLTAAERAARCLPNGQPRLFFFNSAGQFQEDAFTGVDFRPFGSGNVIGSQGSTLRNTGQLAAGVTRYSFNLLSHIDIAEAFRPFFEAKFVRTEAIQEGQPSFMQGFLSGFFGTPLATNLRCDNAFLTQQNLAQLRAIGRCVVNAQGAPVVRAGVNIFNFGQGPVEILPINRFNVDFGGRGEFITRDTYRFVGGVGGDLGRAFRYEIAGNYGRLELRQTSLNNLLTAEFLNAVDAVRQPDGSVVCRNAAARAAGCVPINLFGVGSPSQAALDYVNTTSFRRGWAEQIQGTAFISGDSSTFFNLPGGPIGVAAGVEYRREDAFNKWSPEVEQGLTFLNALQEFNPPAQQTYEAFGEIRVPLLRNVPFFQELTVEAAGRASRYEGAIGTVFAYNVGGTWAPVRDLRIRGNYSTSVRAPTLSDLFSPFSQNFGFISDPCDVLFINRGGPNRAANCRAAGVPEGFVNQPARDRSTSFTSGGNPLLTEEVGRSFTVGAVLQPRMVPGLSVTVDYYNITVRNLIATLGAQAIINSCFDSPEGLNNPFCPLVFRNPDFTFAEPATISGPVNFQRQETEGIDADINYRRTLANGDRFSARFIGTYVLRLNNFISPTDPNRSSRQRTGLGDPNFSAQMRFGYGTGPVDVNYQLRYIGRQTIGAPENYFGHEGRPPINPTLTREVFYPAALYHNVRIGFTVNERMGFYFGVDNIGDKAPPFGLLGTAGGDPYDSIGRVWYSGANIRF